MIGAIAGDMIGSVYEDDPIKTKDFSLFHPGCRFTDDTVLTAAIAQAILGDGDYRASVRDIAIRYPDVGDGRTYNYWLMSFTPQPMNSCDSGAAKQVSPVGFAFDTVETVLAEAARTAKTSHGHPEGIKGAQATALAVYLARTTRDKVLIWKEVTQRFGYDLGRTIEEIRPTYTLNSFCPWTVPEAIIAFLDSDSYEDAIRNAISLGGDSNTLACITGGIAEAYYGPVDREIRTWVHQRLTPALQEISEQFCSRYGVDKSGSAEPAYAATGSRMAEKGRRP